MSATEVTRGGGAEAPRGCEVLVCGGGVIGSAVAYFLAAGGFDGRVVVVERDPGYADSSTARSVGGIRQQFSTPENIRMSRFGAEFLRAADELLAVDGVAPGIPFVANGYLFLAGPAGEAVLRANHTVQRAEGAAVRLLEPGELARRFPWLSTAGVALASLGERDEGWTDPWALLQGLRRKARSLGVRYLHDELCAVERIGGRVRAVRLRSGARIECAVLVNAAGPAAARVAAMAGVELPVRPRRRQAFAFRAPSPRPDAPLVIDPSGLYFRPEGEGFICGIGPRPGEDPDCETLEVDAEWFEERIWPLLAARVPEFERLRPGRAWAGLYAYNTLDQNAILGPHPELPNLLFANGFSGHGLQQAPAVGRGIAELIVHGAYRTLDLSRLGYQRIAAGEPLAERNVV